jgi:predicted CXXCH cytochrome family protein
MKNIHLSFLIILVLAIILIWLSVPVNSQSVVDTKHNLSITSTGTVKATIESEICIFCHTPHNSAPRAPLWNKNATGTSYILYNSSTLDAVPGQPDGSSILCLSCHDGTIALGEVVSRSIPIAMTGPLTPRKNLTTNLSDDHPVSMVYDGALATADGQLKTPPQPGLILDQNSKLQCNSCHDPHKSINPKFLIESNEFSSLCFICHDRTYWPGSTHKTSVKTWNGTGTNPWQHIETPYANVSQNACSNCHNPHNANGNERLLKYSAEEDNCLDCHNGNVAAKNVQSQFAKSYKHNVYGYSGIHDPVEQNAVLSKHVECQDCHNPHASNASTASAPMVNGFNLGVPGINQSGNPIAEAINTYEICYKCHAGNSWSPGPALPRKINEKNVRLEFGTSNPSFHPIVGPRNNTEIVNNLIPPNTASTVLYCTSCHASDNSGDPAGPHGSIYPQILKLKYVTTDNTIESASNYALCYSCHNRNNIINDINTFSEHKRHIVEEKSPCSACHDSHGISITQGNSTNNSNLINFRTDIVSPDMMGRLRFEDLGFRKGRCYLTCHGEQHNPESY